MPKVKIPKRVAGVKIPKKVRRKAKKALRMAEGPGLREVAAVALKAATSARAACEGALRPGNGHGPASRATRFDGEAVAEAIRDAALDGVRRFLEGFEEGLRKASAAAEAGEPAGDRAARGKSRRPSRSAEPAPAE